MKKLYEQHPVEADVITGVPDSGVLDRIAQHVREAEGRKRGKDDGGIVHLNTDDVLLSG